MICQEYYPAYTTSYKPDCENCKHQGRTGCTNIKVLIALQQKNNKEKEN